MDIAIETIQKKIRGFLLFFLSIFRRDLAASISFGSPAKRAMYLGGAI